ncbi:hypothetical protein DL98DRAFT_533670 [Cadophora sp. DSE1049]|nr:hypothetical protein DL98DRAFT_533670 [Cadophora sp. DSE1049]
MVPFEQETVTSPATDGHAISNTRPKEDTTTRRPTFHDIPFDVRLLMWKDTLQDKTRVVLAKTVLLEGNEYVQPETFGRLYLNQYILEIVPDKTKADSSPESVAELAATFLQPDIADNELLSEVLQVGQQEIFNSQNILFMGDLPELFRPISDRVLEREIIYDEACRCDAMSIGLADFDKDLVNPLKMLGDIEPKLVVECRAKAEHLAFYAFPPSLPRAHSPMEPYINEKLVLQLIQWLKELKTLYIVVDMRGFTKKSGAEKPRFVPGASGMGKSTPDHGAPQDVIGEAAFKKSFMAQYHHAWRLKSLIVREVRDWNNGVFGGKVSFKKNFLLRTEAMAQLSGAAPGASHTAPGAVPHPPTSAKGFKHLPYDLRLTIWHDIHQDADSVILTAGKLEAKTESIEYGARHQLYFAEFVLRLTPSKINCPLWPQPSFDPKSAHPRTPAGYKAWFNKVNRKVLGGKNIVFINDLVDLFSLALAQKKMKEKDVKELPPNAIPGLFSYELVEEADIPNISLGACCGFDSLAVYSSCRMATVIKEEKFFNLFLNLISALPPLSSLYIILDPKMAPNITPLKKPRFFSGITGILKSSSEDNEDNDGNVMTLEQVRGGRALKASLMEEFRLASQLK